MPVLVIGPLALLFARRRIKWLEWSFIIIGVITGISFLFTDACFLTTWEQELRILAGESTYTNGFVRHYLGQLFGLDWPDIWTTWLIRFSVAVGVLRVGWLWWQDWKQSGFSG